MSTKKYIYTRETSKKEQCDLRFVVYRMENNVPYYIGSFDIQNELYKDDITCVTDVIKSAGNKTTDIDIYIVGSI